MFWRKRRVLGAIGKLGLEDWWLNDLSTEDRSAILATYRPMGSSSSRLIEGDYQVYPKSYAGPFLANLATWLNKPGKFHVARKIAEKALVSDAGQNVVNEHFMYANLEKVFYRQREMFPEAISNVREICERSVDISSRIDPRELGGGRAVSHACYGRLISLEVKDRNFDRAIALCVQAEAQGWNGDWQRLIARTRKAAIKARRQTDS